MQDRYDVLILGAGAAGLAAARVLATSGRRVAVIEARDRVGGRIFTRRVASPTAGSTTAIELGAEFIHGLPVESWQLIREAGLETYELDGSSLSFADGRLQPAQEEHSAAPVLKDMMRWLAEQPGGTDETFAHYLSHTALPKSRRRDAVRYVEGFNAADHRLIGVAALAKQQEAEDRIEADRIFRIRAGYDSVPTFLQRQIVSAGGTVFLDKPVTTVKWRTGAVSMGGVDSAGHPFEFHGDRAIITLPLGVVHAGSVRFDPEPSRVLTEAFRMAMGAVVRVPMLFRSRFWRDQAIAEEIPALASELEQLSFLFTDSCTPATWWTPNPDDIPLMTGWVAGPDAAGIDVARGTDPNAVRDRCLNALSEIFHVPVATLANQLVSWHFHDWSVDEFARGAYSYAPSGALSASANMADPVGQTLYFAGEHTTVSGHWGTVHGALQSGEAAAAKITAAS